MIENHPAGNHLFSELLLLQKRLYPDISSNYFLRLFLFHLEALFLTICTQKDLRKLKCHWFLCLDKGFYIIISFATLELMLWIIQLMGKCLTHNLIFKQKSKSIFTSWQKKPDFIFQFKYMCQHASWNNLTSEF